MEKFKKKIHVKPVLYSYYYQELKEIAIKYGYNLLLSGSLNRDMDLVAIAWDKDIGSYSEMIADFCNTLGGKIQIRTDEERKESAELYHGRINFIIDLNRGMYNNPYKELKPEDRDKQYYLDISVIPPNNNPTD